MVDERLTSWEAQRLLAEQCGGSHESSRPHRHPVKIKIGQSEKPKTEGKLTVDALVRRRYLKDICRRVRFPDL